MQLECYQKREFEPTSEYLPTTCAIFVLFEQMFKEKMKPGKLDRFEEVEYFYKLVIISLPILP